VAPVLLAAIGAARQSNSPPKLKGKEDSRTPKERLVSLVVAYFKPLLI